MMWCEVCTVQLLADENRPKEDIFGYSILQSPKIRHWDYFWNPASLALFHLMHMYFKSLILNEHCSHRKLKNKNNMSNRFKIFSVKQRMPKVAYNRIKLWKKNIRGSDDRSPRLIDPWCGKIKNRLTFRKPLPDIHTYERGWKVQIGN